MIIKKRTIYLFLTLSLITFTNCTENNIIDPGSEKVYPMGKNSKNWELIFKDEFNTGNLDNSKWSVGCGWGFENDWSDEIIRKDNIFFDDGNLVLKAEFDSNKIYSGAISSKNKFFTQYGFFEARIKASKGNGFTNRWWIKQNLQDWSPAIDIVKISGDSAGAKINNTALRWLIAPERETGKTAGISLEKGIYPDDFHVFGLKWNSEEITVYLDGIEKHKYTEDVDHIDLPLYLILNLEYFQNKNMPVDSSVTAEMRIDYIRVWKSL